MRSCQQTRERLSEWLDNETSAADATEIHQHLRNCPQCQQEWESLQSLDRDLKATLQLDGVDERISTIRRVAQDQLKSRRTGFDTISRRVALLAALAAAILVALFVFRGLDHTTADGKAGLGESIEPMIVARLVKATGDVQVMNPGNQHWDSIQPSTLVSLEKGARLRTDDSVLCELQTVDDGKIRVDRSCEVVFRDQSEIELIRGKIWCLAPEKNSLDIEINSSASPNIPIATMTCPSGSEFQCGVQDDVASCQSLSPTNSKTEMWVGSTACSVGPGESVSIDSKQNVQRNPESESTKIWQLPLLAIHSPIDDELRLVMQKLLAPIGMTKAMHFNEQQIRALGPAGAIPLLAYAATESDASHLNLRRTAVSLARDLADESAIDLLTKLASDPDASISKQAAETLNRIARDQ